jgi:hypothetical protein
MDEKDNTSLERGASNDITRLRWRLKTCENIIARLMAESERLRLTDDEREALVWCAELLDDLDSNKGDTIHDLLERLT